MRAGARQVEVGEAFTVELTAVGEQAAGQPQNSQIRPPRDVSIVGESESTQMFPVQTGAGISIQVRLRATWQLVAQKPGRFVIPAPTVEWEGRRVAGTPVTIDVVPATGGARRQQPSSNPFLMPGGPSFTFSFPLHQLSQDDDASSGPRTAPELGLPTAPDPSFFVRAVPDRKSAVVGQQIAVSIYIYLRDARSSPVANHDAPLSDFLRLP